MTETPHRIGSVTGDQIAAATDKAVAAFWQSLAETFPTVTEPAHSLNLATFDKAAATVARQFLYHHPSVTEYAEREEAACKAVAALMDTAYANDEGAGWYVHPFGIAEDGDEWPDDEKYRRWMLVPLTPGGESDHPIPGEETPADWSWMLFDQSAGDRRCPRQYRYVSELTVDAPPADVVAWLRQVVDEAGPLASDDDNERDWREEVANGDTTLSLAEWVRNNR